MRIWIADGTVIKAQEFAAGWAIAEEALAKLEKLGELPAVWIDGGRWYPSVLLEVNSLEAREICRAQGDIGPVSKMFFFTHEHGGMGGLAVPAALPSVGMARILQLAEAWRRN